MESLNYSRERTRGGRTVPDTLFNHEDAQTVLISLSDMQQKARLEDPHTFGQLEKWLDSMDYATLAEILSAYARRSGVSSKNINSVPRDHMFVIIREHVDSVMMYNGLPNIIAVNQTYFAKRLRDVNHTKVEAEFVHGMCHEYTHATGRVDCATEVQLDDGKTTFHSTSRIGLSETIHKKDETSKSKGLLFDWLNEGVTERIAYEVFHEYRQRVSEHIQSIVPKESHYTQKSDYIEDVSESVSSSYNIARFFVSALTHSIAEQAEVPEDVVWHALIRQYYSGELQSQKFTELLKDLFGTDFIIKLAHVDTRNSDTELEDLIRENRQLNSHYSRSIERWLMELNVSVDDLLL